MRLGIEMWVLLLLLGCDLKEEDFLEQFYVADCAYVLSCLDGDALGFQGITEANCVDERPLYWESRWEGCEDYDGLAAKACAADMEALTCPDVGQDPTYPAVCDAVFLECPDDDNGADE